ncbi:MAG TPA: crosslink repair DNA glycosylase YcaQ family protein, partial [Candidatus Saccharimonadales bacterium]|nr:crosslink repair DNA glycosylase YcaQ family protein [Candidatus Saccharimonadales bacterium]
MTDVSATALNRATLARQHLLERAALPPVAAIEAVAGLQAQEAASPYIGLWTRLVGFEPSQLDRAFAERNVVKGGLMRSTLHVVSARDYRHFLPALLPMLRSIRRQDRSERPSEAELARLFAVAAAFTAEPRTLTEVRAHLAEQGIDGRDPDEFVWWLRRNAPFIHAPADDVPWSFGRRPRIVDA